MARKGQEAEKYLQVAVCLARRAVLLLCEGQGGVLLYVGNAGFRGGAISSQEFSILLVHQMNRHALTIPHTHTYTHSHQHRHTHTQTHTQSHPVGASRPSCGCCSPLNHRIHNNLPEQSDAVVALKHRSTLSQYSLTVFISEVQLDENELPFLYFHLKYPNTSIYHFMRTHSGIAMERLKFKNSSKQSRGINKGAFFFFFPLIPKHSCGIFTASFSRVNTTSETGDWELYLEFCIYLPAVFWRAQFDSERLSLRRRKSKNHLPLQC